MVSWVKLGSDALLICVVKQMANSLHTGWLVRKGGTQVYSRLGLPSGTNAIDG